LKNFLNNNEKIIQWLTGLGFPIALIISSWLISTSIENTKVDTEYVTLAINILNKDVAGLKNTQKQDNISEKNAIRSWAIRVLDAKSPVKLTALEKDAFKVEGINFKGFTELEMKQSEMVVKELTKMLSDLEKE
jgi:hypothetical protein